MPVTKNGENVKCAKVDHLVYYDQWSNYFISFHYNELALDYISE